MKESPSPSNQPKTASTSNKKYEQCKGLLSELTEEERIQLVADLVQNQSISRSQLGELLIGEAQESESSTEPFTLGQALERVRQAREQLENNRQASVLPIFQQLLDEFHQRIPKGFKTKEETQRVVKAVNQLTDEYGVQLELDGVKVKPQARTRGSIRVRGSSSDRESGISAVGFPQLCAVGQQPDPRYYKPSKE